MTENERKNPGASAARDPQPGTARRRPSLMRRAAAVLAVLAIAAVGVLAVSHYFAPAAPPATAGSGTPAIGGPFTLVNQDGETVTEADFRGRYMLIYFGYTYCPDICPMSLQRNVAAMEALGEAADPIVPVLISVDPERDTPEYLKRYVEYFHPRMVGLTGTPEQVRAAANAYRVYYAKAPGEQAADDGAYLVDHSGFTYLMGPDGKFVKFYRHDMDPEAMAESLREVLAADRTAG
jgi:protein SCO1/2